MPGVPQRSRDASHRDEPLLNPCELAATCSGVGWVVNGHRHDWSVRVDNFQSFDEVDLEFGLGEHRCRQQVIGEPDPDSGAVFLGGLRHFASSAWVAEASCERGRRGTLSPSRGEHRWPRAITATGSGEMEPLRRAPSTRGSARSRPPSTGRPTRIRRLLRVIPARGIPVLHPETPAPAATSPPAVSRPRPW